MTPRVRSFLGIVAGLIVGSVVIALVERLNGLVFSLPPGVDVTNREALAEAMSDMPALALVGVLVAWGLGTFLGSWTAVRIGVREARSQALIVGMILLAAAIVNMLTLPHPVWFWIVGVLLFVPSALLGAWGASQNVADVPGSTLDRGRRSLPSVS